MGQRSVERPRSVSTALNGELGIILSASDGSLNGVGVGCELEFGDVPSESAAIRS